MKPAMTVTPRRKPPSVEPAAGGTFAEFVSARRSGLGAAAVVLAALAAGAVLTGSAEDSPSRRLALDLSRHLYETARLTVGGMEANQLAGYQQRNAELMGRLME